MTYLILDPATQTTRTLDFLEGHDLDGMTVREIAGPIDWRTRRVDWSTLELVDDLTALEAQLHSAIDGAAEQFGSLRFGARPQQEAAYLRKQGEAVAWQEDADPALFPVLSAEAEVRGMEMGELAGLVIAAAAARVIAVAKIEAARIRAKLAVSAAAAPEAMAAAAAVDWEAVLAS